MEQWGVNQVIGLFRAKSPFCHAGNAAGTVLNSEISAFIMESKSKTSK